MVIETSSSDFTFISQNFLIIQYKADCALRKPAVSIYIFSQAVGKPDCIGVLSDKLWWNLKAWSKFLNNSVMGERKE